jgi:hypothetical protein
MKDEMKRWQNGKRVKNIWERLLVKGFFLLFVSALALFQVLLSSFSAFFILFF